MINNRPLFQEHSGDNDSSSSAGISTPSSGSSAPSALIHKQATLQRIGQAASNRRRSNPFSTDKSDSVVSSKKKTLSKDVLGITRNASTKEVSNEKVLKDTSAMSVMTDDQKQSKNTNTELCPAKDNASCAGKTTDVVDKVSNDTDCKLADQSNDNSANASESVVQPNVLHNLFKTYASSDSSGEE